MSSYCARVYVRWLPGTRSDLCTSGFAARGPADGFSGNAHASAARISVSGATGTCWAKHIVAQPSNTSGTIFIIFTIDPLSAHPRRFASLTHECLRAIGGRRLAQVRPAVLLPVGNHADALRKALERGALARIARPGFRLPQPIEVRIGQTAVAVLVEIEGTLRLAQLQQHRRGPVVAQMRVESFKRGLVPCGIAISAAIDRLQIGGRNL